MHEITDRAATASEIKILKTRFEYLDKPFALHYAAAAALACICAFALPRVFGIGTHQAAIISMMVLIFCVYKISDEKGGGGPLKKLIAGDLLNARVREITVKNAVLSGTLELNDASFFCFEIDPKKTMIVSRELIERLGFPSSNFTVAFAPESGVVFSIITHAGADGDANGGAGADAAKRSEYAAKFSGAQCLRDCEIIDAAPGDFMKMPGEKYFTKAYESVNINKKSGIFNELAAIFSGGLIFYGLGYDATYGAALGWAASHTLTLFMILALDGLNLYDYYVNYLICELKPWQYRSESKHSRKLQSAFVIINTVILFGLACISEPELPYLAVLAASFAMSVVLIFIPLIHVSSAQTFIIELGTVAVLYLIGFHEAAAKGFLIICLIMMLIGLADKQHKIGMAFLNLLFGAEALEYNNLTLNRALGRTPVINSYKLYLKFAFSALTAFLAITVFLPALPDLLYSHTVGKSSVSPTMKQADTGTIIKEKSHGGIEFVFIPAGSFMMGDADTESSGSDERPVHKVTISKGFYLSATEITQNQWLAVMGGPAPCKFKGGDLPVESVSWYDCMDFVNKMNEIEKKEIYRLPTEAEWEYACRAGSAQKYCCGDGEAAVDEYAWHFDNSNNTTHPAGSKKPNALGLYDMHANVWEWCMDNYAEYMPFELIDPRGPVLNASGGDKKVIRGGGWYNPANGCTSSNRDAAAPDKRSSDTGMRLLKIAGGQAGF